MNKIWLFSAWLVLMPLGQAFAADECREFPQRVVVNNIERWGIAYACKHDDDSWRVQTFRDRAGNDLPSPGQFLYPEPPVVWTQPTTAFVPSVPIRAMPYPHITFYD